MGRSKELGPAVKPRSKKGKDETNIMEETQEIYIPPEKRKQIRLEIILNPLIKMEFNKINNLLGPAHDEVPRFITKKWIEVESQSGSTYNASKPIRFKTSNA